MSDTKFPQVTVELLKRICNGVYDGVLPSVRDLVLEFNTSRNTITLAQKRLAEMGYLQAEGRNGMRILRNSKEKHSIALVATGDMELLNLDYSLNALRSRIDNEGYESVLMVFSAGMSPQSRCRFLENNFAGVLFMNSTLTYEVAKYLDTVGTPFVSSNTLPVYKDINCVESDWEGALTRVCQSYFEQGYRRPCLFFPSMLEGYNVGIQSFWSKLKKTMGCEMLSYDKQVLPVQGTPAEKLKGLLQTMHRRREYPDLMLVWTSFKDNMVSMINEGMLALPEDTKVSGFVSKGVTYPAKYDLMYEDDVYYRVITSGFDALLERIVAPSMKKIHRRIPFYVTVSKSKVQSISDEKVAESSIFLR